MRDQYVTRKNILNPNPKALFNKATIDSSNNAIHMPGDVLFIEVPYGRKHDAAIVAKITTVDVAPVCGLVVQVHLSKKINPGVKEA